MLGTTFVLSDEWLVKDWFGSVDGRLVRDKLVVELLTEEVGMCHLDADGVTERETVVRLTTNETVVLVVEVKSLISQESHGDESFTMVLINLCIHTKLIHATDVCIEFLSEFVTSGLPKPHPGRNV